MDVVYGEGSLVEYLESIDSAFNNINSGIISVAKKAIELVVIAPLCSVSSAFIEVQYPLLMIPIVVLAFDTEAQAKIRGVVVSILTKIDEANCNRVPGSCMQ